MILPDVNLLLYAYDYDASSPFHAKAPGGQDVFPAWSRSG
jgi:hypothetical protein